MNKQELFKQADYNFQRGNCELAKKYLSDFLAQYPREESAWMLMARIVEEPERKIACYERVLKINPSNSEAKIGLVRIKYPSKTLPKRSVVNENPFQMSRPFKNLLRGVGFFAVLTIIFGTASYVVVRSKPESTVAKLLTLPTPTLHVQIPITGEIAAQTRAEMSAKYPQYAPLVDALLSFAMNSAENGSDGAPERPGAQIAPSDASGLEAKTVFENALSQPGSQSSATLTETQLTSWLAMEIKNSPDLPLSDVQVYLQDDKIKIWGVVTGSTNSTSALIMGNFGIDTNKKPGIDIESVQIGAQTIPDVLVSQIESWLNQLLIEEINKQAPGLQIMNINIQNGVLTISGM
jgi:hypothetical protein